MSLNARKETRDSRPKGEKSEVIEIKGARVHNLKNIDLSIPRDKFIVITGF